ncbi:MAG TPA: AmmeMemoRadiSam system protein B [Candidatus Nitrosotenuis sp.]|nr:AmmeMemoRadiSam system protein B [Candidatus Nitrosotenuis sp.]
MIYRLFSSLIILITLVLPTQAEESRPPIAAAKFYPKESEELEQTITELLSTPKSKKTQDLIKAIIVPHAGYSYSGKIAAQAYQAIAHLKPRRIIILGPSHFVSIGETVALPNHNSWQSPLGNIKIDTKLRDQLLEENPFIQINNKAHDQDHAIEVQLPFLQTLFPKAKILPIAINSLDRSKELASILIKYLDKNTLLVVSTDMSHYHKASVAETIDEATIKSIVDQNIEGLRAGLNDESMEMCGKAAVVTLMEIVKLMGAIKVSKLAYTHSGAVSQDQNRVVGYFAATFTRPKIYQDLLTYAYQVLKYHVKTGQKDAPALKLSNPLYDKPMAVFVTLRSPPKKGQSEGKLRGCIGTTSAKFSLKEAVRRYTMASASEDSRFSPVSLKELSKIHVQLSLLLPAKKVTSFREIQFGKHGVIVSQGGKMGIFLPEVAESFETKEDFLSELCSQKAQLPPDCYKNPETKIQVFETIHFQ